jgi:parafibromin
MIPLYRKRTHIDPSGKETETHARYFVVDSIDALAKFGTDAWDRVVCVMTTGQTWQFRPYKWSEPRQLFHHGATISSFIRFVIGSCSWADFVCFI